MCKNFYFSRFQNLGVGSIYICIKHFKLIINWIHIEKIENIVLLFYCN